MDWRTFLISFGLIFLAEFGDNFEWADGFKPRFGLIGIDYNTQERLVRESAYKFASICRENKISI